MFFEKLKSSTGVNYVLDYDDVLAVNISFEVFFILTTPLLVVLDP